MSDFDFGFSIVDESELDAVVAADKKAEKKVKSGNIALAVKLVALHNAILPLLDNLAANPEKDYIKWNGKDRVKKIEDFKAKLQTILDHDGE
tara:strand:- start:458 stop:733 length:276 start_codon:yes stop_codon:yes gene_type:complete